jgi:hypothetical protein
MRDREAPQLLGGLKIGDVIGESPHRESTYGQVGRHAWNRGTETGKLENPANGRIHLVKELQAKTFTATLYHTPACRYSVSASASK